MTALPLEKTNRLQEEEDLCVEETWIEFCDMPAGFGEETQDICRVYILCLVLVHNFNHNLFAE